MLHQKLILAERGRSVWVVVGDAWLQVAVLSLLAIAWIEALLSQA